MEARIDICITIFIRLKRKYCPSKGFLPKNVALGKWNPCFSFHWSWSHFATLRVLCLSTIKKKLLLKKKANFHLSYPICQIWVPVFSSSLFLNEKKILGGKKCWTNEEVISATNAELPRDSFWMEKLKVAGFSMCVVWGVYVYTYQIALVYFLTKSLSGCITIVLFGIII